LNTQTSDEVQRVSDNEGQLQEQRQQHSATEQPNNQRRVLS